MELNGCESVIYIGDNKIYIRDVQLYKYVNNLILSYMNDVNIPLDIKLFLNGSGCENMPLEIYSIANEIDLIGTFANTKLIDLTMCAKLKKFTCRKNIDIDGMLPNNLVELYLPDDFDKTVNNLPINLKILDFTNNDCFNETLDNLPDGLEKLICGYGYIRPLDMLPQSLVYLAIGDCYTNDLHNLPNGLKKFLCGNDYCDKSLNMLPQSVVHLSTRYSTRNQLDNLPNDLISLHLEDCSESLDNLPDGIEELILTSFRGNINKLPQNIKHIRISIKHKQHIRKIISKQNINPKPKCTYV